MADIRVLGAVELRAADQPQELGPPKQRAVLAALVVDAGRPVPVDTLVDRVWDEAPPAAARNALYAHIMRVRRLLARVADPDDGGPRLDRRAGGYVLDIDRDQVDLHRFHRLVDQARAAESADDRRASLLGEALSLWRGTPLADLSGAWVERLREGWRRQWLDAVVAWARVELRLGNHSVVISRLHDVLIDHPLVEPVAAMLMEGLYAAGRAAEALDVYAGTRQRLVDELGTDPGPALQQLHQTILRGDTAGPPALPPDAAPVPRQLPGPPQMFTGRTAELATLEHLPDPSAVVISAIDGTAGIGKTAVAVSAAHRVADRYPDGQLFVDLRGHTPGMAPREPAEALEYLLHSLGVPGEQIPDGVEERAALYRTRLAGRRALILLDNAAAEAQVAPLLPGAPGCLVLVTSRRRLAGLDCTRTLSLETLPAVDAIALFVHSAGGDRLGDPPSDVLAELVELCGRLPLAIRIAGARLRSHPTWEVSHLVERLRDQQRRLGELTAGQRSVTAALDLSYQHLRPEQRRAYRLLGAHPGPEIDPYATAALLDCTVQQAGRRLDELLDNHLLQEPVAGRFRFHDLIRAHAAHLATGDEQAAVTGLLDHYRHTAAVAADVAYPDERDRRPRLPPARNPGPDLPDPAAALRWLDAELPNLMAVAGRGTEHLVHLSTILQRHLRSRGRYREAGTLHREALAAARATGHRKAEMNALTHLGDIHRLQSRYDQAVDCYRQALRIAESTGDRVGELDALNGLGSVQWMQGRYEPATDCFRQALRLARAAGDPAGELDALTGLGHIQWMRGRYRQAGDCYQQALRIARAAGHRRGKLNALNGLGDIHRLQGRYEQATDCFQQAFRLARAAGHRVGELQALTNLSTIHRLQGRYEQAGALYHELLDLARVTADPNFEFEAWHGLGRLRHATGDPDAAIAHHDRALALADELGQPVDQARAHDALAHALRALGSHEPARDHWRLALDILTALDIGRTDDEETTAAAIRAHLAALDRDHGRTTGGSAV